MESKNPELHIFCVWNYFALDKARKERIDSIVKGIGRFIKHEALWGKSEAEINLSRIYKSTVADAHKLRLIANKKFLIYVVEDPNPIYSFQETTTCIKEVNINTLKAKNDIRELTGEKFGAHGTDCLEEARSCCWLLFAANNTTNLSEFSPRKELFDQQSKMHRWTIGYNGWKNYDDLYKTLSICDDSIIINRRGAHIILGNEAEAVTRACDIDLLSKNRDISKLMLQAKLKPNSTKKHEFTVSLDGSSQRVDIRDWRDDYFCPALSAKAISCRSIAALGAPICSDTEVTRSLLLYNLVVNKKMKAFDQYAQLINKFSAISNCKTIASPRDAQRELSRLLRRESFWIPEQRKAEPQSKNIAQYRIKKEEYLMINEYLKEASISILDIPSKLSKADLRYKKSSKNYFDSEIYKIEPGTIGNSTPLCLKIVHDNYNQSYKNFYRKNKHKILEEFESPYTPDFIGYQEVENRFGVLTSWLKGESLELKLRKGKLNKPEALSIATHALEFLSSLTHKGWLHGDIWERNILVYKNFPYFTDFCNSTKLSDTSSLNFLSGPKFKGLYADDAKAVSRLIKILKIKSL